jgi:MtfA peptidase
VFTRKRKRREQLRATALPAAWQTAILRNVPYWQLLSAAERNELAGHVQVLMAEKPWEGCGGLDLSDEIRVTIAAQAGLLLLNRETDYFPKLGSILVYPGRYLVDAEHRLPDGTVIAGEEIRSGESWLRGSVVFSWQDVLDGAADPADGQNVVLHEFAHQLDSESGANEGAPLLDTPEMQAEWARVLGHEYDRLRGDLATGRATFLRPYAATSPAEFFAVVTEAFFEQPIPLRQRHPELYLQYQLYYRQDPAARFSPG